MWTLRSYVADRWKPAAYPSLKHSTRLFYENMINTHIIPVFGKAQLRTIDRFAVQTFLTRKVESGSSWKTVKHIRTVIGTILESAVQDDLLTANPARRTKMPRRGPVKERPPINPEEIVRLIEKLPEPSGSIACILAGTGLRIGELLALRWQDVDLQHGLLSVRQSVYEGQFDEPKSATSKRRIPIGSNTIAVFFPVTPRSG